MGVCSSRVCAPSCRVLFRHPTNLGPQDSGDDTNSRRSATVYMAIYDPTDQRDPRHWAIYINDPNGRESIQQLLDKFDAGGYRVAPVRYDTRPNRSGLWRENVLCGHIPAARVNAARQLIQNQYVDNVSQTWNCQAWAIEALESLQNAGIMSFSRTGGRAWQRFDRTGSSSKSGSAPLYVCVLARRTWLLTLDQMLYMRMAGITQCSQVVVLF